MRVAGAEAFVAAPPFDQLKEEPLVEGVGVGLQELRIAVAVVEDVERLERVDRLRAELDLVATVKQLAANGVKLLPIPENYYDDLEAKTELSPEAIDTFKSLNILYDRDGDAEFLQAYTHTFDERFFFELVERRGGYKGFGASNAHVRLAAQSRLSRTPGLPRR